MNGKRRVIDLFCGVGGLSMGFKWAGYETLLAIDMWDDAVATFNRNHGDRAVQADMSTYGPDRLRELCRRNDVDGIIGGPPCQGFSTVGTRDIRDPRNSLYLELFRVVDAVRPRFFVIENVRGLLTFNEGAVTKDIVARFGKIGYNVTPSLVNAADYGVPQNRHRVFFVGVKEGWFVPPERLSRKVTVSEALSDLPSLENSDQADGVFEYPCAPQNDYQAFMRKRSKKIFNHHPTLHSKQTISIIARIPDGGKISDLPERYWHIRKYNKAFQRMNSRDVSNTIDTGHRNYFHYRENRVPSVRECARIQSFPDDFVFYGSKTSQCVQVGNAVPPLLAYAIARNLDPQKIKPRPVEIGSSQVSVLV